MKFFIKEKLGTTRSITPDGFLLIENTPVARTGEMIYGPGETPVEVGPDGIARIERSPAEVFRPETLASCNGKPVVNEHPTQDVTPDNWNDLAVGIMLHPRRGVGAMDDTLIADLLITNRGAIQDIKDGKLELSLGYDADYDQIAPGRGKQRNIVVNHCAIVDNGRCGSRCAIGDSALNSTRSVTLMTVIERIKEAFKKKDESALEAALGEISEKGSDGKTVVHVHVADKAKSKDDDKEDDEKDDDKKKTQDAMKDAVFSDARFTGLSKDVADIKKAVMDKKDDDEEDDEEDKDKETKDNTKLDDLGIEAPPGTDDKAMKAKDSAYLEDSFQETVALAEIISPGVQVPTFDKAAAPLKTYDAMCQFRRKVLDRGYQFHSETRDFMDEMLKGRELKEMKCSQVRDVFLAVGTWRKRFNNANAKANDTSNGVGGGTGVRGKMRSIADINKRNAELYK